MTNRYQDAIKIPFKKSTRSASYLRTATVTGTIAVQMFVTAGLLTANDLKAQTPEKGLIERVQQLEKDVQDLKSELSKYRVKDVKVFTVDAVKDTTEQGFDLPVDFPEPVDVVAIQSLLNDGHDMHMCIISQVGNDGRHWKVHFFQSARGAGARWIPAVRFVGVEFLR